MTVIQRGSGRGREDDSGTLGHNPVALVPPLAHQVNFCKMLARQNKDRYAIGVGQHQLGIVVALAEAQVTIKHLKSAFHRADVVDVVDPYCPTVEHLAVL